MPQLTLRVPWLALGEAGCRGRGKGKGMRVDSHTAVEPMGHPRAVSPTAPCPYCLQGGGGGALFQERWVETQTLLDPSCLLSGAGTWDTWPILALPNLQ